MTDQIRADTRPTVSNGPAGHAAPTNHAGDPVPEDVKTVDALRSAIDGGAGGDKNPVVDPAMSPLGTDDEVGGHVNTPEQIRMAAAQEVRPDVAHHPEERRPSVDTGMIVIGVAIVALIGAALFLI